MARKIHIFGADGFVGGCLFEKFSEADQENTLKYDIAECDLLSPDSITTALSGAGEEDVLVMAAAVTRFVDNSYDSMMLNIQMAENIGQFLREHSVAQVVFFSTPDVYGLLPDNVVIEESLVPCPNDYYSISKMVGEHLLTRDCSYRNIPLTILRMSGVYGKGGENKSTVNGLIKSARERGEICIYDGGDNLRDFVFVEDMYKVVLSAINRKVNAVLNVATGSSLPIRDIVQIITEHLDEKVSVVSKTSDPLAEKRITHMVYDTARLQTLLPEVTFTPIREGIKKFLLQE